MKGYAIYWFQDSADNIQDLEDLADVLAKTLFKLPRYNAQGRVPYSVGEHSLLVLTGLLHDAYTGMGDYEKVVSRRTGLGLERLVDRQIAKKYVDLLAIKAADLAAKEYEVPHLYRYPSHLWGNLRDFRTIDWFDLNISRFVRLMDKYFN